MQPDFLDRYSRGTTLCHRLPAGVKLLLALAVIVTAVSLPISQWPLEGCLACVVFMGLSVAKIPLAYLWRRVVLLLPLVVCMALTVPASRGFAAGLEIMAAVIVRAIVSFLAGLWLVNVTPFDKLIAALQRCGMPRLFAAMLAFMYRYMFVLFDELDRMRTARKSRSFGSRGAWSEWKTTATLIGLLLIRALDRAERIHGAMSSRGWSGRIRTLD